MNKTILKRVCQFAMVMVSCVMLTSCSAIEEIGEEIGQQRYDDIDQNYEPSQGIEISMADIPEYAGQAYIAINNNIPDFEEADMTEISFEWYSDLDDLGRCGVAFANVGQDLMPTEERESISQVKPSGWQSVKYDIVDGKYLYNRCHLIGYQLTAENANKKNLITGTRYLNIEGMLLFENMVADYVKETANHVLYRVTPIFEGNELVARGVQMEGYSVEDQGEAICFNVFAYNVQPGIVIDYRTGESWLEEDFAGQDVDDEEIEYQEIRGNSKSKIYHCPGQSGYEGMADSDNLVIFYSEQEAIDAGYRKAKR
ncbi:MAG: DNA/RNA non-specific endonuclease [Lachnospiraceae bacterium]|nr:DNA/RNA non-specific endonuclease [Robinsoniella sp.]MDY3767964.1 DNA/RNA non-specific endonuclease [Lachnospiraceae bacterium]